METDKYSTAVADRLAGMSKTPARSVVEAFRTSLQSKQVNPGSRRMRRGASDQRHRFGGTAHVLTATRQVDDDEASCTCGVKSCQGTQRRGE